MVNKKSPLEKNKTNNEQRKKKIMHELIKILGLITAAESLRGPIEKLAGEIAKRLKERKYIALWVNIIRRMIAMGPEEVLTALMRVAVWQTVRLTEVLQDKTVFWTRLGQDRFRTIVDLNLLAEIIKAPEQTQQADLNKPIDFEIGTPIALFGIEEAGAGKHLDREYLRERGYDFCEDYDVFNLLALPDFKMEPLLALLWTKPLEHSKLEGPSVMYLSQRDTSGGSIALGFYALGVTTKLDVTIPIILRVVPVKVGPATQEEDPPDVPIT